MSASEAGQCNNSTNNYTIFLIESLKVALFFLLDQASLLQKRSQINRHFRFQPLPPHNKFLHTSLCKSYCIKQNTKLHKVKLKGVNMTR